MPELPEVESARKLVEELCAGRRIVSLCTKEQGGGPRDGRFDDIVIETANKEVKDQGGGAHQGLSDDSAVESDGNLDTVSSLQLKSQENADLALQRIMIDNTLVSVKRKGKNLWFNFATNPAVNVLFHFGMTGSFVVRDRPIPSYKSFKVVNENDWPPKFTKLELKFSNGIQLAFCDPRRLGRIRIRTACESCPPISELAPDPVTDPLPTPEQMFVQLQTVSAPIKAVLLDQEKLFCGIGNYLADEVLYQSGIHPETKSNRINTEGCRRLLAALQSILQTAIACNADYSQFPRDWLFHYRWSKGKPDQELMPSGHRVVFETHGGRTSAIVPVAQPKQGYYLLPESSPQKPKAASSEVAVDAAEKEASKGADAQEEKSSGVGKGKKRTAAILEGEPSKKRSSSRAMMSNIEHGRALVGQGAKRARKAATKLQDEASMPLPLSPLNPPPPSGASMVARALRRVTRILRK